MPDTSDVNEALAIQVGKTRRALQKELMSAKACLVSSLCRRFRKPTFDFAKQRLVSDDGRLALQWRVRFNPDAPPSYNNQQTNCGTVVCVDITKEPHG